MGIKKITLVGVTFCCCLALSQTEDERARGARLAKHEDVFRAFAAHAGSPRLEDMKPNPQGVILHERMEIRDYMLPISPLSETDELKGLASRVDAVIAGTTVNRYSAIDASHTFLYSDWIVKVSKVYKNASTVQVGSEATVTRMGGDLMMHGRRIIDKLPAFPDLVIGRDYIFYLKALPETSSFLAISGWTFDVTGTSPVLLADPRDPTGLRSVSSWPTRNFIAAVEGSTIQ